MVAMEQLSRFHVQEMAFVLALSMADSTTPG